MNAELYNNLMKDVSKVIRKHLDEALISWTMDGNDNSSENIINITGKDLRHYFEFQWLEYPDDEIEGICNHVDDHIYINMPDKDDAMLLSDTVIRRLKKLQENKKYLNKALDLLRFKLPQTGWTGEYPTNDYPFIHIKNLKNASKDIFKINSEQWEQFAAMVAYKDIPIRIYDQRSKEMWKGDLIDTVIGDDSYPIGYFLGRYIQSIKEPCYAQEAYPCILVNEYAPKSKVPIAFEGDDFEYLDPESFASFDDASEDTKKILLEIIDKLGID